MVHPRACLSDANRGTVTLSGRTLNNDALGAKQ
jgi:hypothetical protein